MLQQPIISSILNRAVSVTFVLRTLKLVETCRLIFGCASDSGFLVEEQLKPETS